MLPSHSFTDQWHSAFILFIYIYFETILKQNNLLTWERQQAHILGNKIVVLISEFIQFILSSSHNRLDSVQTKQFTLSLGARLVLAMKRSDQIAQHNYSGPREKTRRPV